MQIELRHIVKHYGPVRACDDVSMTVAVGSIHGLLGENGAGKSTLMKVLTGYTRPQAGEIVLDGQRIDLPRPAMAVAFGIGMLYQEPMDFPALSVLDNFMAGQARRLRARRRHHARRLAALCEMLGFAMDPQAPAGLLTVGERQQLELMRLLALGIEVLILDEPTTGISDTQKQVLFAALKRLAAEGKSIILVSHKLEDVEALCDRVTVLRQGRLSGQMKNPFDTSRLLTMMFGQPQQTPPKPSPQQSQTVLAMEAVSATGGRTGLRDCTVAVDQGEIAGLAGLEGSGQGVFLRVAAGLNRPYRGRLRIGNLLFRRGTNYHDQRRRGVFFLPGSRLEEGLICGLTIVEHFALLEPQPRFLVDWQGARRQAKACISQFNIKGLPDTDVALLSGGNQQRLLLSFLPKSPLLLLLENPTRGLDINSAHWVWRHLQQYRQNGAGIVFSSAEIDEILMAAQRVIVFFDGSVAADRAGEALDLEQLGRAIAGKK